MMKVRSHQTSPDVNDRAIRLYGYMLRYYAERGYVPTVREMRRELGISSTSTVQYYKTTLIKWGWIDLIKGGDRAIRFTRVTERGLSAAEIAAGYGWEQQPLSDALVMPAKRKHDPAAVRMQRLRKKWLSIREQIKPFRG